MDGTFDASVSRYLIEYVQMYTSACNIQQCEKRMDPLFVTKYWNDTFSCEILKN